MPYFIVLLITLFFCSNAYSENFPFDKNNSGFHWGMSSVKCPLEKENEKLFTINLSSENEDYSFQINCHLQREKTKKTIFYSILEKNNAAFEDTNNENIKFEMTDIKGSFSDEIFSGYTMEADSIKQHGLNKRDDDIFNSLLSLNKFHFVVNDKIENKEKYFEFILDAESAPLKKFEKFCSLGYFNLSSEK